jgi:hypothetical protein
MENNIEKLAAGTRIKYRSQCRQLWLREQEGYASPEDIERRQELEQLLGVKASEIPGRGRPRRSAEIHRI